MKWRSQRGASPSSLVSGAAFSFLGIGVAVCPFGSEGNGDLEGSGDFGAFSSLALKAFNMFSACLSADASPFAPCLRFRPRVAFSGIISSRADFLRVFVVGALGMLRFMEAFRSAICAFVLSSKEVTFPICSGSGEGDGDRDGCSFLGSGSWDSGLG